MPQSYPPQQFGHPGQGGAPGAGGQPQFASPQPPYGAPQGAPQNPYGTPPAYGAGPGAWSPAGGLPPAPPKKSKTGLVIGVVALVVVLVGGVGLWLALRPKTTTATGTTPTAAASTSASKAASSAATKASTAASTKATTTATTKPGTGVVTCSGGTIDSTDYTAKVPTGWECGTQTSSLSLTDAKFDTLIVLQLPGQTDAAKVCNAMATAGTVTALPDTQWGGKTAKTEDIVSGNTKMHVRCVAAAGSVYYLMALPISGTYADIVAGVDGLTGGWAWK